MSTETLPTTDFLRAEWLTPEANRSAFPRIERFLATEEIPAGDGAIRRLQSADDAIDWTTLSVEGPEGGRLALDGFLEATRTDAFLVLRGDRVLAERYFGETTAESRHIDMSVSKSFCGMLAGVLIGEGLLDPGAPVTDYVPELAGGSYDGATVRQVLDMTAAPDFDMTYLGPDTEVQRGDRCAGWRPARPGDPAGTRAFLAGLAGHGTHGAGFQYCSATTDVLAWVIERAARTPYARLMSERIWSRIGAEADALITVDALGAPYACAGMGMRLRDLARFGRLIGDRGVRAGEAIIPAEWLDATFAGGDFSATESNHDGVTYRNQWWIPEASPGMYAVGIFGQYLWVDPESRVVIAKFSSNPDPVSMLPYQERVLPRIAEFAASAASA